MAPARRRRGAVYRGRTCVASRTTLTLVDRTTVYELANKLRPRSHSRTLISTTQTQAGHEPATEPAVLLPPVSLCLPTFNDEDRRRFQIMEPAGVHRSMHVPVATETKRPEIGIRLTRQTFVEL